MGTKISTILLHKYFFCAVILIRMKSDPLSIDNFFQKRKLFFLSGLPRSGSTLLASLLSQNPDVYVSSTSPLIIFLGQLEQTWKNAYTAYTCPFENHLLNISRGLIEGFYSEVSKPYIIDKAREWPANLTGLNSFLGEQPKIICTVRDIPAVLASFYRLFDVQPRGESNIDRELLLQGKDLTTELRVQQIWTSLIKPSWTSLKKGCQENRLNLHLVEYDLLIDEPEKALSGIYDFLEIPYYAHQFSNIVNPVFEDDDKWGIKNLHKVSPELKRHSQNPNSILGDKIALQYKELQLEFWR